MDTKRTKPNGTRSGIVDEVVGKARREHGYDALKASERALAVARIRDGGLRPPGGVKAAGGKALTGSGTSRVSPREWALRAVARLYRRMA